METKMRHRDIKIDEFVGAYPTCCSCNARDVVREAGAGWSLLTSEWVLKSLFDTWYCDACGETNAPNWQIDAEFRKKRVRRLNDAMRRGDAKYGSVVITQGVQALGQGALVDISKLVSAFEDFSEENDPHQEHDFGAVTWEDEKLFWKIDYFDRSLKAHSPDKANPDVTHRVLTIMLASEY